MMGIMRKWESDRAAERQAKPAPILAPRDVPPVMLRTVETVLKVSVTVEGDTPVSEKIGTVIKNWLASDPGQGNGPQWSHGREGHLLGGAEYAEIKWDSINLWHTKDGPTNAVCGRRPGGDFIDTAHQEDITHYLREQIPLSIGHMEDHNRNVDIFGIRYSMGALQRLSNADPESFYQIDPAGGVLKVRDVSEEVAFDRRLLREFYDTAINWAAFDPTLLERTRIALGIPK